MNQTACVPTAPSVVGLSDGHRYNIDETVPDAVVEEFMQLISDHPFVTSQEMPNHLAEYEIVTEEER